MGLATARNLQRVGVPFVGFEQHSDVGGLWDITNPHSTVYESAHLISSKKMTEFTEFPMEDSVAHYPHHSELKRYFRDFADRFGLREQFEFSTRVLRLEPEGEGWSVETECNGAKQRRHFDGVLIANGTLHHPHLPTLTGEFSGRVMHSSAYKSPVQFAGQRVLIIGCGNSAADIAVDAVHHAASVDMSVRRGYYFLPKFITGRPIDSLGGAVKLPRPLKQFLDGLLIRLVMGKPSDYGLPDPDYKLYESHPVMNSLLLHHLGHGDIRPRRDIARVDGHTVHFTDGEEGEFDLILFGTGYDLHYPFIDQAELNWKGAAPSLYLNVFVPQHDTLFVMGMIEAAGLGWQGRYEQAELVARYIQRRGTGHPGAARLRALARDFDGARLDGGYRYLRLDRMAYYVHKDSYRRAVATHIAELSR